MELMGRKAREHSPIQRFDCFHASTLLCTHCPKLHQLCIGHIGPVKRKVRGKEIEEVSVMKTEWSKEENGIFEFRFLCFSFPNSDFRLLDLSALYTCSRILRFHLGLLWFGFRHSHFRLLDLSAAATFFGATFVALQVH